MKLHFKLPKWANVLGGITAFLGITQSTLGVAQHSMQSLLGIPGIHVPAMVNTDLAVAGVLVTMLSEALGHIPDKTTTTIQENATTGEIVKTESITTDSGPGGN